MPVSKALAALSIRDLPDGLPSLAAVRDRAEAVLAGTERRDTLSAFNVLAARLGIDLAAIPATALAMRQLFQAVGPVALNVSPRRYANVRSLVGRSVLRFGLQRTRTDRRVDLTPAWAALLASAAPIGSGHKLNRLARYCSDAGIAPGSVRGETLHGFFAALEAETLSRAPRAIGLQTIVCWNRFRRLVPGWPQVVLASPRKIEPFTLKLTDFPAAFQEDLARWERRVSAPDVLDPDAPARALRPATVANQVLSFRRFASALARGGLARIDEITGLAVFFEGDRFQEGLRPFLRPGASGAADATHTARNMASHLRTVARHHVKVAPAQLAAIERICARLKPEAGSGMGRLSRDRLEQFDDPANVTRLLGFPRAELARALRITHPRRRAWGVQCALAVAILIDASLRLKNLREIRHDRDIRKAGDAMLLHVPAAQAKNRQEMTFHLSAETVDLLERYLREHRLHLAGAQSPWLFPGAGGKPISTAAMRIKICGALKKRCGLDMHPHLFRHALAKIVVERDPSLYGAVSRHLGHRSISTTLRSYLGSETAAASRKLGDVLRGGQDLPGAPEGARA